MSSQNDCSDQLQRIEELFTEDNRALVDAPFISIDEWLQLRQKPTVVLVDVRTNSEQDVSMIPGAISKEYFENNFEKYSSYTVVSYCTIGGRAGRYTQNLRSRGVDALNLKGSVLLWAHAGQKFIDANGNHTTRVHVSGSKWNLLPIGYEAKW